MARPPADSPSFPSERFAQLAVARAGGIIALGLSLLAVLYVGSYAVLLVGDVYDWDVVERMDERVLEVVQFVYWPLIQIVIAVQSR